MSKDELHQIIVEAGDKLYGNKNSSIYLHTSEFLAEIMNIIEELLFEVLCSMEEIRKSEEKDFEEKD